MNKKLLLILVSGVLVWVLFVFFVVMSWNYFAGDTGQPITESKCDDGICDRKEIQDRLCPEDCKIYADRYETCGPNNQGYCIDFRAECEKGFEGIGPDKCRRGRSADCCAPIKASTETEKTCSELGGTICSSSQTCSGSWLDASDSERCCDGVCEIQTTATTLDYEDSPFGFHPGNANNYVYTQDMGAVWSREGTYIVWSWVDVNRNGNFKFTDATAPAKSNHPAKQINYDNLRLNTPKNINIMTNVCPFRDGGKFADSQEKDTYYDFVKKMVERYDGDSDLGCTLTVPDCYNFGDNDYPSKEIIDKFKTNPIKYWQVCNKVTDFCDGKDCKETYAEKYAEVQKITYQAVKEADKTAGVLIAGDSRKELYPKVFQYLNGNYIDIIDLHRFGTEDGYNPKEDFYYLKASLQSSGFDLENLRFWITETGTYSGDPVERADGKWELPYQSEWQQARGLFKRYVSALSYKIEKIFWAWNIVEGFKRDCGIFDYTGLVYDGCDCNEYDQYVCENGIGYDLGEGVKKLSYYTYKLMDEKLEGSDWDNIETVQESDNAYIYKFMKQGKPVWVAWNDDSAGKTISLDIGSIGSVIITEAVPKYETGQEVTDYSTAFNTEIKTVSNGKVTITLGESPIFVEKQKVGHKK